jgi:hypothetical protein
MKHLTKVFAVLALALGLTAATVDDAQAGRRYHRHHHNNHGGLIAGAIIGGLMLGALANSSRYDADYCYRGPRRCVRRYRCFVDDYGDEHCRTVRSCHRPAYCD